MSHLNNFGICQHVFNSGPKKGLKCSHPYCSIHDEYDCNLARYLNLPQFIIPARKIDRYNYFTLVGYLQHDGFYDIKDLLEIFSKIFELYYIYKNKKQLDELFFIYIYTLLDTPQVMKYTSSSDKFRKTMNSKLDEFMKSTTCSKMFMKYIKNNFIMNKRFVSIKKNTEYKKRIFRIYMKTMVLCNRWFNDTMEKRYSPGGIGAIEAKNSYDVIYKTIKYNLS